MNELTPAERKPYIHTRRVSYGDVGVDEVDVDIDGLLKAQLSKLVLSNKKCCLTCAHPVVDCPILQVWLKTTESPIESTSFYCSEYVQWLPVSKGV